MAVPKPLTCALVLLLSSGALFAGSDHLDQSVETALREYRVEANISNLSTHQKTMILNAAYSGRESGRRMRVLRAVNGGVLDKIFN